MFQRKDYKEKQLRYSIRKVSFGAASVAISALYLLMGNAAVSASEVQAVNGDQTTVTNPTIKDNEDKSRIEKHETTTEVANSAVVTLDKTSLTKLIEEIDGKFTSGKYTSKTEESVNRLKAALEEARTALSNAKTQAELSQAHANLIVATTKLQTKPEEKKEAPAVDTTNGKATVGKKATNTEKASDSNSIANSGSRDERNGKALDRSKPFRTDASPTDTDPAANQTYTLPGDSANLKEVADSLINLPTKITNETKIASINEVGALQNMAPGELKDINEFGGWKASNGGVFAIARRTDKGVFPIETVNTVLVQNGPYRTWLNESTFDRSQDYALFLAEVRTKATKDEAVDNGSVYRAENHYANKGIGLAKFKGIEKTFKAYSKSTGSDVIVSFKTGFTGDIDGYKAKYRVEVFAKDESGTTSKIYDQTFKSDENIEDATKKVVAPRIGGDQYFNTNREPLPTREALNEKLEQDSNKRRLSTSTGTFTSKGIVLAPNVTEYTVRISPGDNANLGMGYQVPWKQYALPISGLGFTIDQDTSRVAKTLLQRVYDKLKETEERDTKGKTEATINAYKAQLENVKNLLAGDLKKTQDYKDIVTAVLADQQALRTDKTKLNTSNNNLLGLINEDPDPRIGKTPNSITPYDSAKTEAISAQSEAQTILNQENPDPDVVAAAVSKLNEKLAELKAARAELVVAATEAQKTKLQNDSDALKEADKTGKTPKSIAEYEAKYETLKTALTAAKNQAKAVLDKTENAGKVEATDAQIEVDKIKAELDKAAALLKEKGNTAELEKAKNDLKTLTQETNVTAGKTQATADKYNAAKAAAEAAVTAAEAVIGDINSTTEDVANALAEIKVKKAALEAAKAALVDKVTEAQKIALGNAETDLAVLGDVDLAGKTKATADAYKAETEKLTADIEAAKREAAAILADPENKTQAEAALVQAKIEALKAKLEAAKAKLVAKADTTELATAKADLDTKAKEVVPTEGKTKATVDAYNEAKAAAEAAVTAAEAVINDENVTDKAVAEALANVNAKKAALEAAKAALVDKVTPEQKTALGNAETDLAVLGDADLAGKTKETADAYKAETGKLTADIEAAKREAAAILADPENKTQVEAALVQAKIEALKAKLEAAKAKLVAKADTTELSTAKADLDTKAKEVVPTEGKTKATVDAYNEAKAAAEAAVTAAEAVINDENVTAQAVAEALANVNAKKAALEAAKAALVDKVTPEQKTALGNAETDLAVLGDADLAGKTKATADAYKAETGKLTADIEAAKREAAAILADPENKTQAEAALVQAKIEALKAKLEAAKAKLVAKADTTELSTAKAELDTKAKEVVPTEGKTKATVDAYNEAKAAAEAAVTAAEAVINDENVTATAVAEALANVNAKKAALEAAKAALVDKVTPEQKTALGNAETDLAVLGDADLAGKTKATADAYKAETEKLTADIEAAKREAAAILADPENKTQAEAALVQAKIEALKAKLEAAKAKLVAKADTTELATAKADLDTKAKEVVPTEGKTKATVDAYNEAKAAAEAAVTAAEAVINDENVTDKAEAEALANVNAKKAALEAAKAALVDKVTPEQKTALGNAETDLAVLGDADLAGKTKATADAYKAETGKLTADIEAAKREAAAILADPENKTQAEAALVQAKIEVLKAKLEAAKAKLVAKADTTELSTAKAELDTKAKEVVPTEGKTKATVDAYNEAKAAAEAAVTAAEAVINDENVTATAVAEALANVNAKKAALEAAKAALVDKVTPEQKTALGNAETDLAVLGDVDLAGKTKATADAYKAETGSLTADIEEAKREAAAILADPENKTQAEAALVQAKIEALKAKLEAAKAKLVAKADTTELATAKAELDTKAKEVVPTEGKTKATVDAYNEAKSAAEAAVTAAEAVINDENVTATAVAEALANVNAKKAALEAAKAALVDKITQDQKDDLANAEENLKLADTTGKTKDSIKAYNNEVAKLSDELAAAKQAAKDLVDKGDNAGELEAYRVQAKINKLKSKLAEAAKLLKEIDKSAAKKEVEEAAKNATDAIVANNDLTPEQKEVAKVKVAEEANKAIAAIDKATTEDDVTAAKNVGKFAIEKEAAKVAIEAAKAAKEKEIDANDKLSNDEKQAAKEEVQKVADTAKKAIDAATDQSAVDGAKTTGTTAVSAVNPVGKEKALDAIQKATEAKLAEIDKNEKLSDKEKDKAKAEVAKAAIDAVNAIIAAADQTAVDNAKNAGTTAVSAVNPVGKEKALVAIDKALAAKEKEIDANDKLSDAEKKSAKEAAKKAADEAKKAINAATDQAAVDAKQTEGTKAVEAVTPVGKEKALAAIDKALAAKEKEIDANDKLSDAEKKSAKEAAKKAADEAKKAINAAADQAAVDAKQTEGTKAVEAVTPVGKEKALAAIDKALAAKEKEIDANDKLSDAEKKSAKEAAKKAADEAKKAINAAADQAAVDVKQADGTKAVEAVNPVGKEKAKAEIEATKAAKEKAIDSNPDLTDAQKAEAKAKIAEEAKKAIDAIDKATTTEAVAAAKESGKLAIEKEAEKAEIEAAKAAKEKAIDARTDLTDDEKAKAKAKVAEEAKKAIEAIENAKTHNDASAKTETGKDDIKKINPISGKETAKKAIDEALAAKEKAIDARTDLLPEEKEAAKKAARKEAEVAKNAIDKATTSEDINKVLEDGKENIAKINPVGAKEEAKKAVEEALMNKEKEIDARTDLTPEEKAKAKALAREEAKVAKDAIDKATSIQAIEKALRPFLYQIDQDALVFELPELTIQAALQASVTGVVTVERGKAISQADIISKLNLPETVTVMNIDLPDTTTLGRKSAKVTLRLAGGKETTVNVPVEVVESSEEHTKQNNQQHNTQVKPQEDEKPTVVPSDNSEQPAVNQTEDVKENPSNTSQETKGSNQKVLPNTGTGNEISIFGSAAMTVLTSLGLVATSKKKEEE